MKRVLVSVIFFLSHHLTIAQSIDDPLSKNKMKKDLAVFKEIRLKANSGLYKYRTKKEIDSIYHWAAQEIEKSSTYLDFFNIICQLTDYEGSSHNLTLFSTKHRQNLRKETFGYFPYPVKWIDGRWRINFDNEEIPTGAEIITINKRPIEEVNQNLHKYSTTDGDNITGKRIGLRRDFSLYYRWQYGLTKNFRIEYKKRNDVINSIKTIPSVSYKTYYTNFNNRFSKPFDQITYEDLKVNQMYSYEQ